MTNGEKIKWAREKMGWTPLELARKAELEICISCVEDGVRPLTYWQLAKVADALKREPSWFIDGKEPDDPVFLHCRLSDISGMSDE